MSGACRLQRGRHSQFSHSAVTIFQLEEHKLRVTRVIVTSHVKQHPAIRVKLPSYQTLGMLHRRTFTCRRTAMSGVLYIFRSSHSYSRRRMTASSRVPLSFHSKLSSHMVIGDNNTQISPFQYRGHRRGHLRSFWRYNNLSIPEGPEG